MDENNKIPANEERKDGDSSLFEGYSFNFTKGIFPLAVLAYLIIGFRWGLWHPGWIIFVGAWLLQVAVTYFRTGRLKISIYGVAMVAFIVLGFAFGMWGYAWLAFVVAWVLDEMIVSPKKKKKKKKKKSRNDSEEA